MPEEPWNGWPLPPEGETAAFVHLERHQAWIAPHVHAGFQLQYVARGSATLVVEGTEMELEAPRGALVPPGLRHAVECRKGPVEMFTVQLAPEALERAAGLLDVRWPPRSSGLVPVRRATLLLRELIHQLVSHAQERAPREALPPMARCAYGYLCMALVERLGHEDHVSALDDALGERQFQSSLVGHAVEWLEGHLTHSFRVAELARRVGTSPRNLRRAFHQELGQSPGRYLAALRLREAARLLRQTERPVKEVALGLGFVSPQHFTRAFRQRFGLSPVAFRRAPTHVGSFGAEVTSKSTTRP